MMALGLFEGSWKGLMSRLVVIKGSWRGPVQLSPNAESLLAEKVSKDSWTPANIFEPVSISGLHIY